MKRATRVYHGMVGTRTYGAWRSMKMRCHNPNSTQYKWYGARGIKVCDHWRYSFTNFLADMGEAPSEKHTIDRYPNNEGDYEPSNTRWATMDEQKFNKRPRSNTVWLTFQGETLSVTDWGKRLGINRHTIFARIKYGWKIEDVLTREPHYGLAPR